MMTVMNQATPSEILLALRSPGSGWLGVLACAIDEASHDPRFDAHQRDLAMQLLNGGVLPEALIAAARTRAAQFEAELENQAPPEPAPARERPKLTLVGDSSA